MAFLRVRAAIVGLVVLAGCTDRPSQTDGDGTAGASSGAGPGSTSAGAPTSSGGSGGPGGTVGTGEGSSGSASTSSTSGGEVTGGSEGAGTDPMCPSPMILESPPSPKQCDPFAQDCPPCEKCMAWDGDRAAWGATKCVPVARDPAGVGEACFIDGFGYTGVDDCAAGAYCWEPDAMHMGTCVALCAGTEAAPVCEDPATTCLVLNELAVCLRRCDPLLVDCPGGQVCVSSASGEGFACVFGSGEAGGLHGPCASLNGCDPGLLCVDPGAAVECEAAAEGCCEPVCDLAAPDPDAPCAGAGQQCRPFYAPDEAPPGDEDVGVCALP